MKTILVLFVMTILIGCEVKVSINTQEALKPGDCLSWATYVEYDRPSWERNRVLLKVLEVEKVNQSVFYKVVYWSRQTNEWQKSFSTLQQSLNDPARARKHIKMACPQ